MSPLSKNQMCLIAVMAVWWGMRDWVKELQRQCLKNETSKAAIANMTS